MQYTERMDELRDALNAEGVSFRIAAGSGGSGYITISLDSAPDNFSKADSALMPMGLSFDLIDDWGAKSIGEVMVEKV